MAEEKNIPKLVSWKELQEQGDSVMYVVEDAAVDEEEEIRELDPSERGHARLRQFKAKERENNPVCCVYQIACSEDSVRLLCYPLKIPNHDEDRFYFMTATKASDGTAKMQGDYHSAENLPTTTGNKNKHYYWRHTARVINQTLCWRTDMSDKTAKILRRRGDVVRAERIYYELQKYVEHINGCVRKTLEEGKYFMAENGKCGVGFNHAIPEEHREKLTDYYRLRNGQKLICSQSITQLILNC